MQVTPSLLAVVRVLLDEGESYVRQICTEARMYPGTASPILARLVAAGYAEARTEDIDPVAAGRPRRKYFRLTPTGKTWAWRAVHPDPLLTPEQAAVRAVEIVDRVLARRDGQDVVEAIRSVLAKEAAWLG
jgi:PadR family transcriptional regulator, regulatory protein PadR